MTSLLKDGKFILLIINILIKVIFELDKTIIESDIYISPIIL